MKTINKAEYWLLDLVVIGLFPLHRLTDPDLELIANREHHGLSHLELLGTLVNLFEDGSLIAVRCPDDYTTIDFLPKYQEIDLALKRHDRRMQYKLTAKGGSQWESLSNPNWDWCISGSLWENSEAKYLHIAEQNLEFIRYAFNSQPILSSKTYQVLRPWQATYWKTLPEGHRIEYQTQDLPFSSIVLRQDWPPEVQDFEKKSQNWYTNPFK